MDAPLRGMVTLSRLLHDKKWNLLDAEGREQEAALALRAAAPHALPNTRIIALADRILGREGRLVAARDAMGPATPVTEGPLVELVPLR